MKKLGGIIILALLLRLFCLANVDAILIGDSEGYYEMSKTLHFTFDNLRTPVYPLFIRLMGTPKRTLLAQVFIDLGVIGLIYYLSKNLIAPFLYAISFPSMLYSVRLMTEVPFTFLLLLGVILFIRKRSAWAGLVFGLGALTRPVSALIPFFLFQRPKRYFTLLLVFFITLAPWQIYKLNKCGRDPILKTIDYHMETYVAAQVKAQTEGISKFEAIEKLGGKGKRYILDHPLQLMRLLSRGMLKMYLGVGRSGLNYLFGTKLEAPPTLERVMDTAKRLTHPFVILLFLIQIVEYLFVIIGFRFSRHKWLFLGIMLYFTLLTGIVGYSRFRVPVIPFILILSAEGIRKWVADECDEPELWEY